MPRSGLTRESVIETAARLADTEGLEQLTLARLAAELGVRPPSLFNHISGLPDLRRRLQLRGLEEMAARAGRAAVGRAGKDAVLAAAAALRRFAHEHPGLYAASLPSTNTAGPELNAAGERFVGIFFDVVRDYGLEGTEAVHAVRGLFSTIHGFITLDRAGTFGMPVDADESFRWLVENYVAFLGSGGPRRSAAVDGYQGDC
jgi:AcrR family transcriptional regulator